MKPVRKLAVEALVGILRGPGKPKDVLELLSDGLETRDRAFLMEIVYGVLRQKDTLDMVLSWLMKKPTGVPVATLNNLRAGIYQIFFMRVPEWAVVNESVELEARHRGLVNGVLRNAIRERESFEKRLDTLRDGVASGDASRAVEAIASLSSHPAWMVRRWVDRLGVAEAHALAEWNNKIPSLALRVNTLRASRDDVLRMLEGKGIACKRSEYSPVGLRLEGVVPFKSLGLGGLAVVQDEAAQLVSLMLDPRPGQRVLDACAAPGGKTTHMAAMMQDRGEIVALDLDGSRLERLMENVDTLDIGSVRVVQADLMDYRDEAGFDRVLIDAPCSALGVIRRNPDIKYRRKSGDLARYGSTQYSLLSSAAGLLRPGGRMVYAVCSTEPEEGEAVVERFLKSFADFDIISDVPAVPSSFLDGGYMRTWPHRDAIDGFFAVLMKRKK